MLSKSDYNLYRYEPSEEDIAKARGEIVSHEDAIGALDMRVSDLLKEVQRVHEEKIQHQAAISRWKGVLTLARRIPGELLARIFESLVDDGWTRAPIIVSQVCSAWRDAAKSPRVWSNIYVDCDRGDPVARSAFWLSMAQHSPLHVTIRTNQYTLVADAVMDQLLDHVSNWKTLTLEVPSVVPASYVLARCTNEAPELRELRVVTADDERAPMGPMNMGMMEGDGQLFGLGQAFRQAPKLSTVHLTANTLQSMTGIPSQITTLSLKINPYHLPHGQPILALEILGIIDGCPHLQNFSLNIERLEARELRLDDPARTTTAPHLLSLILDIPSSFMPLVQHFRAPLLHSLHLRCPDDATYYANDDTRAALRTFIRHSSPPIRLLEFYDIDVSQDDFLFCFAELPLLEELRLHGSEVLDETIKTLAGSARLCPNLSRLDLRWCGHLTGSALVDLVRSRQSQLLGPSETPISELTVINCSSVNEAHILEIASMTICRLCYPRGVDDYCSNRGCCENSRYRRRFQFRHAHHTLTVDQRARIKLS